MCLAVPMKVEKIASSMAKVSSCGVVRDVDISLIEELELGDYVLVHAGFAIERIDEKLADETILLLEELTAKGTNSR